MVRWMHCRRSRPKPPVHFLLHLAPSCSIIKGPRRLNSLPWCQVLIKVSPMQHCSQACNSFLLSAISAVTTMDRNYIVVNGSNYFLATGLLYTNLATAHNACKAQQQCWTRFYNNIYEKPSPPVKKGMTTITIKMRVYLGKGTSWAPSIVIYYYFLHYSEKKMAGWTAAFPHLLWGDMVLCHQCAMRAGRRQVITSCPQSWKPYHCRVLKFIFSGFTLLHMYSIYYFL